MKLKRIHGRYYLSLLFTESCWFYHQVVVTLTTECLLKPGFDPEKLNMLNERGGDTTIFEILFAKTKAAVCSTDGRQPLVMPRTSISSVKFFMFATACEGTF